MNIALIVIMVLFFIVYCIACMMYWANFRYIYNDTYNTIWFIVAIMAGAATAAFAFVYNIMFI